MTLVLTNRLRGLLHKAASPSGLSYRSACKRGIDNVHQLRDAGYVYLYDRGEHREFRRFVFRATEIGKLALTEEKTNDTR